MRYLDVSSKRSILRGSVYQGPLSDDECRADSGPWKGHRMSRSDFLQRRLDDADCWLLCFDGSADSPWAPKALISRYERHMRDVLRRILK